MRQWRYRHQPKCAHTAGCCIGNNDFFLPDPFCSRDNTFWEHSLTTADVSPRLSAVTPLTCRRCGIPSGAVMRQALVPDWHPVEQKLHRTGWEEEGSETNRDTSFLENALQYNQLCEIGLQGQRGHGGKQRPAGQVWDLDVMMMGGKDGWSSIQFLWRVISLHVCYRTLLLPKAPGT